MKKIKWTVTLMMFVFVLPLFAIISEAEYSKKLDKLEKEKMSVNDAILILPFVKKSKLKAIEEEMEELEKNQQYKSISIQRIEIQSGGYDSVLGSNAADILVKSDRGDIIIPEQPDQNSIDKNCSFDVTHSDYILVYDVDVGSNDDCMETIYIPKRKFPYGKKDETYRYVQSEKGNHNAKKWCDYKITYEIRY